MTRGSFLLIEKTSACYYYPDTYTISLSGDSGVASTSGSGSYLYGTTAYTSATLKEGYHYSHVVQSNGQSWTTHSYIRKTGAKDYILCAMKTHLFYKNIILFLWLIYYNEHIVI